MIIEFVVSSYTFEVVIWVGVPDPTVIDVYPTVSDHSQRTEYPISDFQSEYFFHYHIKI